MSHDETRHNRFEVLHVNITRRTNGNIIFREQMESALVGLGGFSIRHVPAIMKAILKKKRNLIMAYYPLFRANLLGAYPDKDIDQLWESIVLSPALVERGALYTHLAHGEGEFPDCAVCYGIKNKFPVHPTVVMDGEGFKPGSLDQKTRNFKIDVVLGLLARYKKEEKVLADSNVIVIDYIEDIPTTKLMDALDGLPTDIGRPGFPDDISVEPLDHKGGEIHFDMLRPKGEPLSAAAKDVLAKNYLKPEDLAKSFDAVIGGEIKIIPSKKTDFSASRVHVVKAGDIHKRKKLNLEIKEIPQEEALRRGVMHSYMGRLPGCTCRDGEDHDLCPVCHKHSMRGMSRIAKDLGVCIVTAEQGQRLDTKAMAESHEVGKLIQKEDMEAWVALYKDGMPDGTPIQDYDLHHPPGGDRLMRMRTDIKPLKEVEELLGVPTNMAHIGGIPQPTVTDMVTEDDLAQKEIVEPEVCKCNVWAGCTCGVMERERARKAKEEG